MWRLPVVHRGAWRGLTVELRKFHAPLTQLVTQLLTQLANAPGDAVRGAAPGAQAVVRAERRMALV
ncbi:MAG: hypothetical protein Q8N13_19160 [Acidovorax sp.]|nr:hypothetical protein [Acidovorax sp.]